MDLTPETALAAANAAVALVESEVGDTTKQVVARGGAGGTVLYGGYSDLLEPNKEIAGAAWYGRPGQPGIVAEMVRDPHVRESLGAIVGNLLQGLWAFEPAPKVDDVELAAEIADFCAWQFLEYLDWQSILESQSKCFRDGFSILEYTDDTRDLPPGRFPRHPGRNLGTVYSGFHHRPAWSITEFKANPTNEADLASVTQQSTNGPTVEIPATRFVRTTQEQEGAQYTGFPKLRSAYGPWKMKRVLLIVRMILHERTGAGVPSLELPEKVSKEEAAVANSLLENIRAHEKGSMTLPFGYKFSWNTNDGLGSVASALEAAIEKCDRDIAHNTSSGFMLLGGGSYALAEVQQTQHQISMDVHASSLARPWNRGSDGWSPVRRLVAVNYGEKAAMTMCPTLIVRNLPSRKWDKVIPLVTNAIAQGLITPDDQLEEWARVGVNAPKRDAATARELKGNAGATPAGQVAA